MSCFLPAGLPDLPSLPGLPKIPVFDPSLPNLPKFSLKYPSFSLPDILLNWHPNLCDLLILIYILYLFINGNPAPNPTLDEAQVWITSITSGSDYFGLSNDVDVLQPMASFDINIESFTAKVYPHDRDLIMKSIYENFDSNNEFGDATTSGSNTSVNKMCAIFELNNLKCDEIGNYYELKKTQFTRNIKLTRV
tara:strand:- start:11560 stop:12138 length:579 start_codon:yes stop_codon:yes gene_type:complete